jgi:ubiquitin C-terminal hydrolase
MQGIENLGNNCYVNAVIQCLRYMHPLGRRLIHCRPTAPILEHFCALLYQGFGYHIRPFLKTLSTIDMDPHMQSDAHEFYLKIIDHLFSEVNVSNPMEGKMVSTLTCQNCDKRSEAHETFYSTSVGGGVTQGLCDFEAAETVRATCEGCGNCRMTKQLRVSPGEVWVLHLKRFEVGKKLNYSVALPRTLMRGTQQWHLSAVCNHIGSMYSGHYTATAKTSTGWYMFNDEIVTALDDLPLHSSLPYILFYKLQTKT